MMGDRQWPDPRGWEALTQQEAEQDARQRELEQIGYTPAQAVVKSLEERLAVAVRERDQARDALREATLWLVVPSDIPEKHHEALGRAREQIRAALAGEQP